MPLIVLNFLCNAESKYCHNNLSCVCKSSMHTWHECIMTMPNERGKMYSKYPALKVASFQGCLRAYGHWHARSLLNFLQKLDTYAANWHKIGATLCGGNSMSHTWNICKKMQKIFYIWLPFFSIGCAVCFFFLFLFSFGLFIFRFGTVAFKHVLEQRCSFLHNLCLRLCKFYYLYLQLSTIEEM